MGMIDRDRRQIAQLSRWWIKPGSVSSLRRLWVDGVTVVRRGGPNRIGKPTLTSPTTVSIHEPFIIIHNALTSLAVCDVASAQDWYPWLFGRDWLRPMPEVVGWTFPGGELQVYALAQRAGHDSCTLAVDDIEAIVRTPRGARRRHIAAYVQRPSEDGHDHRPR